MCYSRLLLVTAILMLVRIGSMSGASDTAEPSTLFKTKCTSCHTFGKGDSIGPDLKGVTARHPRTWLIEWIRSSDALIRRGDASALELFRKYRQQRMPDHDLSDSEIARLLDYFEDGGPAADEPHLLRPASEATTRDVELGKKLFLGDVALTSGAVACVFCHSVSTATRFGGSFGPDLRGSYEHFLDRALDQRLTRACMPGARSGSGPRVAESESFALRAFLRAFSDTPLTGYRVDNNGQHVLGGGSPVR